MFDIILDEQTPAVTTVTSLSPTITLSASATVSPLSGVATNFTSSVNYTVTAANTTDSQVWVVTVTVADAPTTPSAGHVTLGGAKRGTDGSGRVMNLNKK